ncbi:MAB_1171c family putative transporter [Streptomyces sp. ATCC 21386]|uniref:MAB_1171c family putative transporter n=1 Tax=Streptomyces sp. ATCC 21386 TaxID=2699428 RepID=UPI001BFF7BBD|nr:MAB_1171c family putative transporter [Streptomyces sp. ATCC 21386]
MRGTAVPATTGTLHSTGPADFFGELYISFWIPTAVLTAALVIKLPSIVKLWRDSLLRAVGGLLLLACCVFVFAVPSVIAWTNRVVGVPNVAAPWVYSLITAFCACCLLMIVALRNGPADRSPATRRLTRWVVAVYAAVIVVLWVLFALADVPRERLRDLDTYYATTPFMREEILLYLVAHTAACLITYRLIRNWVRAESLDVWLRGGLQALVLGCALNLVFDAAKLTAVVARWTGHDLDWLSTDVAPPAAALAAICIAVGFILPHSGQYLQDRWRVRTSHRRLRPLYLLTRTVDDSRVPFALRATPELRLTRRETFIRDALLRLTRHLDEDLRRRAYDAALDLGHEADRAKALAAAVAIQDAVATRRRSPESRVTATLVTGPLVFPGLGTGTGSAGGSGGGSGSGVGVGAGSGAGDTTGAPARTAYPAFTVSSDPTDLLKDIEAVSLALREPTEIEAVRALAASPARSGSPAQE